MTKKELFATLITLVENVDLPEVITATKEELVEKLEHEIELVSKKSTSKASLAKAKADKELTEKIKEVLADGTAKTVSEIQIANPDLSVAAGISNSKVTSLLTKLVATGEVIKAKDKKKSLYSLA